jgi:hypothetical protein
MRNFSVSLLALAVLVTVSGHAMAFGDSNNTNVNANTVSPTIDVHPTNTVSPTITNTNVNAPTFNVHPSASSSSSSNVNNNIRVKNTNQQQQKQGQLQLQGQQQGQQQSNSQSNVSSGNTTQTGGQSVSFTSPEVAPGMAGLVGTVCSTSVTGSAAGGSFFAIGFGTTTIDHQCEVRESAKVLVAMGYSNVAFALMCGNEGVSQAANEVGISCPTGKKVADVSTVPMASTAPAGIAPVTFNAPASGYDSPYDHNYAPTPLPARR